jgi:hypothetical protein
MQQNVRTFRFSAPMLLIICTLIAMGYLAQCDFSSWDDQYNIWKNPNLNPPTLFSISRYWIKPVFGLYIPLTYTIWGVIALIARVSPDPQGIALNPWLFHSANLAMHLLSVLIVFKILQHLIHNRRAACIGALLFAIHPIQVEPVAWIAGMKDVLSGMLVLAAIWQYLLSTKSPIHYFLALLAFIAALLSKPSAIVAPLIIFAIDFWLLKLDLKTIARSLWPFAILSIIFAIIGAIAQATTGVPDAPFWARPFIAGDSLLFYLYKIIWPAKLTIDYGWRPAVMMQQSWFYFAWIVPATIAILLTLSRKRLPELFVAGFIFLAAVFPVLGWVTFLFQFFSTTADHYLYVAMLGPALATAWLIARFDRTISVTIAAIILAILGIRTMFQTRVWRDDLTLFPHAMEINPQSFMAPYNLGNIYASRTQYDVAEPLFRRAIELKSDYPEARQSLATLLEQRGEYPEAAEQLREALKLELDRPSEVRDDILPTIDQLTRALIEAGDFNQAMSYARLAIKTKSDDKDALKYIKLIQEKAATQPATQSSSPQ